MANNRGAEPRGMTGNFNLYRRKGDADMWMRFETLCARDEIGVSQRLTQLAEEYVIKRSGI